MNTILITGCSYGLGRALALKFAKNNCHVYAVARNGELLNGLAKDSSNIEPIIANIATENGRSIIYNHLKKHKELSIIHNAAFLEPCSFKFTNEKLMREHIDTNYLAPLMITRDLLPWLTRGQRVLHITSGAASLAIPGLLSYCTTKAAMQFAIQCLNAEMNVDGIYFANLRPGMIDTPMAEKQRNADAKNLPNRDIYIKAAKENKLISPEIAAEFVAWVMLKTEDLPFSTNIWNIYDETHQQYWLPENASKPIAL
jgi:short-subunit dehydrogenase